jgi:hypothetical protein
VAPDPAQISAPGAIRPPPACSRWPDATSSALGRAPDRQRQGFGAAGRRRGLEDEDGIGGRRRDKGPGLGFWISKMGRDAVEGNGKAWRERGAVKLGEAERLRLRLVWGFSTFRPARI